MLQEIPFIDENIGAVVIFRINLLFILIKIVTFAPLMIALGKSKQLVIREITSLVLNVLYWLNCLERLGVSLPTMAVTYVYSVPANLSIMLDECYVIFFKR